MIALLCILLPLAVAWVPPGFKAARLVVLGCSALDLVAAASLPWTGGTLDGWLLPDALVVLVMLLAGFAWVLATLAAPPAAPIAAMVGLVNLALLSDSAAITALAAGGAGFAAVLALRRDDPAAMLGAAASGDGAGRVRHRAAVCRHRASPRHRLAGAELERPARGRSARRRGRPGHRVRPDAAGDGRLLHAGAGVVGAGWRGPAAGIRHARRAAGRRVAGGGVAAARGAGRQRPRDRPGRGAAGHRAGRAGRREWSACVASPALRPWCWRCSPWCWWGSASGVRRRPGPGCCT